MPTTLPADVVLMDVRGSIATITLNRPDKLNALDAPLIDRLQDLLDLVEAEAAIRAVILTGAGERAFSAGADIAELQRTLAGGVDRVMRDFVRRGQRLTRRIEAFPKPVIAAVNGLAFGGGCEVTEACPLAIAAEHSRFAKPEIRLGFAPPFGGSQRLPRLVGRKRALKMILTGEAIDAGEAKRIGLINDVVPAAELLPAAVALAERIMAHTPRAVAACLASVTRGINLSIDEGLAVEAGHFERMADTPDVARGISEFLERPRSRSTSVDARP
ncbi:crotonase/enoyl-CoA hydratase family protein [Phreatobacter stygius]|uniref:Crotonase/enoyl-CoA hydratase family protein n=1 Tax=Phreatobacter stygius TaxID=1940610 RepID=A0A4D7B5W7_9HYPH|nr:crotonase/enoyl-CoA hydratase family protein [Phreatobacter stygius]QCI63622.1 crotonase/enoyl-CoA hydratase family protein [Phreatobacter stygius]